MMKLEFDFNKLLVRDLLPVMTPYAAGRDWVILATMATTSGDGAQLLEMPATFTPMIIEQCMAAFRTWAYNGATELGEEPDQSADDDDLGDLLEGIEGI